MVPLKPAWGDGLLIVFFPHSCAYAPWEWAGSARQDGKGRVGWIGSEMEREDKSCNTKYCEVNSIILSKYFHKDKVYDTVCRGVGFWNDGLARLTSPRLIS